MKAPRFVVGAMLEVTEVGDGCAAAAAAAALIAAEGLLLLLDDGSMIILGFAREEYLGGNQSNKEDGKEASQCG